MNSPQVAANISTLSEKKHLADSKQLLSSVTNGYINCTIIELHLRSATIIIIFYSKLIKIKGHNILIIQITSSWMTNCCLISHVNWQLLTVTLTRVFHVNSLFQFSISTLILREPLPVRSMVTHYNQQQLAEFGANELNTSPKVSSLHLRYPHFSPFTNHKVDLLQK